MRQKVNKVEAVYQLREAAEAHGRAEALLETERSAETVDALLEAKEKLEEKTVEAIESCEHCGEPHCDDASHKKDNVITMRFNTKPGNETG